MKTKTNFVKNNGKKVYQVLQLLKPQDQYTTVLKKAEKGFTFQMSLYLARLLLECSEPGVLSDKRLIR